MSKNDSRKKGKKKGEPCDFANITGHTKCLGDDCNFYKVREDESSFCIGFKAADRLSRILQKIETIIDYYIENRIPKGFRSRHER